MVVSRREFGAISTAALAASGCDISRSNAMSTTFNFPPEYATIEGRYHKFVRSDNGSSAQPNAQSFRIAYPGVKISFLNTGDACAIDYDTFSGSPAWDIRHGDGPWTDSAFNGARDTFTLYTNQKRRQITTLFQRTEAWQGVIDIHTLITELPIEKTEPPAKKLLFIGDSITCGANCDTDQLDPLTGMPTTNGRLSYGRILGDLLDAQVHLVAYGGKGLVRDWQGLTTEVTAPEFFERALPDDPDSVWDHSQYVPDAIGICLGQNDFNTGIPDRESWTQTYAAFIARIRETAPDATIFIINSPMSKDDGKGSPGRALIEYLNAIVTAVDDPKVMRGKVPYVSGFSEEERHPTAGQHRRIAAVLHPAFAQALL